MTAKEYLRQLMRKDARINALIERQQHYYDLASRRTTVYRDMPGGGRRSASSCEEYVCKAIDLGREIDRRIDEYVDLTREIEAVIASLPDSRHRDILTWRYANGWTWDRIAEETGYDRRQVFRLHGLALLEIDKRCPTMSLPNVV